MSSNYAKFHVDNPSRNFRKRDWTFGDCQICVQLCMHCSAWWYTLLCTSLCRKPMQAPIFGGQFDRLSLWFFYAVFTQDSPLPFLHHDAKKWKTAMTFNHRPMNRISMNLELSLDLLRKLGRRMLPQGINVGSKVHFWRKWLRGLFVMFKFHLDQLEKTVGQNSFAKVVKNAIRIARFPWLSVEPCTKNCLFLKRCSLLLPAIWCQDRIAGRRPNLAQLLIIILFPKRPVLGNLDDQCPSSFF